MKMLYCNDVKTIGALSFTIMGRAAKEAELVNQVYKEIEAVINSSLDDLPDVRYDIVEPDSNDDDTFFEVLIYPNGTKVTPIKDVMKAVYKYAKEAAAQAIEAAKTEAARREAQDAAGAAITHYNIAARDAIAAGRLDEAQKNLDAARAELDNEGPNARAVDALNISNIQHEIDEAAASAMETQDDATAGPSYTLDIDAGPVATVHITPAGRARNKKMMDQTAAITNQVADVVSKQAAALIAWAANETAAAIDFINQAATSRRRSYHGTRSRMARRAARLAA